jgi:uncharacterized protein YukE
MAEASVADLRRLLTATAEANKATAEAGQANALRIAEINEVLGKLSSAQQGLAHSASKVDATLERMIQANSALDRSVEDLKQSMERVAARMSTMEATAATLSAPEHMICARARFGQNGTVNTITRVLVLERIKPPIVPWSGVSDRLPPLLKIVLSPTRMMNYWALDIIHLHIAPIIVLDCLNLISLISMVTIQSGGKKVAKNTSNFTMCKLICG